LFLFCAKSARNWSRLRRVDGHLCFYFATRRSAVATFAGLQLFAHLRDTGQARQVGQCGRRLPCQYEVATAIAPQTAAASRQARLRSLRPVNCFSILCCYSYCSAHCSTTRLRFIFPTAWPISKFYDFSIPRFFLFVSPITHSVVLNGRPEHNEKRFEEVGRLSKSWRRCPKLGDRFRILDDESAGVTVARCGVWALRLHRLRGWAGIAAACGGQRSLELPACILSHGQTDHIAVCFRLGAN
jgi:hypothetical protein